MQNPYRPNHLVRQFHSKQSVSLCPVFPWVVVVGSLELLRVGTSMPRVQPRSHGSFFVSVSYRLVSRCVNTCVIQGYHAMGRLRFPPRTSMTAEVPAELASYMAQ